MQISNPIVIDSSVMADQVLQRTDHQEGQEEVVEYMDQMDGRIHPAFNSGLQYEPKSRKWMMKKDPAVEIDYKSAYAECFAARDAFVETANKYLKKIKQPEIDISTATDDWATVEASMESACAVLEAAAARDKDTSGFSGKLKKGFQGLCKSAKVGLLFTELIPSDLVYTAPLRAGLSVIFKALEGTAAYREEVCTALERLPAMLDNYEGYMEIAAEDEELHRRTAKLYAAVCWTLNSILHWFVANAFVAGTKRLFNPAGFSNKLNDKMADVNLAAKDFKAYASRLMLRRQDEAFQLQAWNSLEQAKMSQDVDDISHNIRRLNQFVEKEVIYQNVRAVFDSLQPFLQTEMKRLIIENTGPYPPPRRIASLPPETVSVTSGQVLEELLYNPSLIPNDVQGLLNLGSVANPGHLEPNRILAAQKNPRILAWLTVDEPSLLLVNGGADPISQSMSFVSAKIVQSLLVQDVKPNSSMMLITLAYFCGRHWDYRRDEAGSPDELAMSLLLQLIDQYQDFESQHLQECLDKAVPNDVAGICEALQFLLNQLPNHAVVFLVIDGLPSFSTPPERQLQMREVVEHLVDMYRKQSSPILKFLLAGPTRSNMEELFEPGEIVDLPINPPPTGGYGLSWWQNPL